MRLRECKFSHHVILVMIYLIATFHVFLCSFSFSFSFIVLLFSQAFQFGMFSAHDMRRLSTIQIVNKDLYQHPKRIPVPFGCLDPRLGISDKSATCFTCGERLDRCTGHFGYVKLELPVLHVGYFKAIQTTLQCICKICSRVLLGEDDRAKFLRRIRNPRTLQDPILRQKLFKAVIDRAKKTAVCPFCGSYNGSVKKIPPLKLIHERYNKRNDIATQDFHAEFDFSVVVNPELRAHLSKAQDDLNPLRILALFTAMTSEDVELLCMDPHEGRPDRMLLTHLLVPPVCIRPSVNVGAQGT
jgi:DNA-directed RNA polymerase III subunit RPC1